MSSNSLPLYADDSHLVEFDAVVVKSGPRFIVLDRTAFYPESGGQPSDEGIITYDEGRVEVLKVLRRGVEIYHYLDSNIPVGAQVHGCINWAKRSWNMRRHSAEHLLTGLIEQMGEPPKIYSDLERLEYQPSSLGLEQIRIIENRFNMIVDENVPVSVYYEERTSIDASGDPRKQAFLKKIPRSVETLRMVDIGSYASTFCFGTHVKRTGEIGKLLEINIESAKKEKKIIHFRLKP